MRTVRLLIGYQGTHYLGWQSQKNGRTVQEVLEAAVLKITKQKTAVTGSSRTDSGVHARGLVAHFRTKNRLPDEKLRSALNFYLPSDIVVYSVKTASEKFHARFSARSKLYQYDVWNSRTRPLFEAPYVLWFPQKLDVSAMKKAARYFKGKRDFSAFRDASGDERQPVKKIKSLIVSKKGTLIRIRIEADGFLTHMVRIIVGTLLEVGRKKLKPSDIPSIIRSKNRSQAGPTAKAHGLSLLSVRY